MARTEKSIGVLKAEYVERIDKWEHKPNMEEVKKENYEMRIKRIQTTIRKAGLPYPDLGTIGHIMGICVHTINFDRGTVTIDKDVYRKVRRWFLKDMGVE